MQVEDYDKTYGQPNMFEDFDWEPKVGYRVIVKVGDEKAIYGKIIAIRPHPDKTQRNGRYFIWVDNYKNGKDCVSSVWVKPNYKRKGVRKGVN
jgi:hypothetical protein